ncbi:Hypothetical protein R9X50_00601700 [Acrodontium crateriforme]|uniref:Lipase B n=1 Tax=Acrodontium crateriforme TaxID=150365 RepID=A0AAQ3M8V5_9PEZI|nr:Hypothetical protein R9X50_00601700 [Acrodontium crateriforme]
MVSNVASWLLPILGAKMILQPCGAAAVGRRDSANASAIQSLLSILPTATPTSPEQAQSALESIFTSPTPASLLTALGDVVEAGLTPNNVESAISYLEGPLTGEDSTFNINLRSPYPAAYPKAESNDAPYDLSEATLRAAIYIPSTFQYGASGAPQPIILVPGTGNTGFDSFSGNYIQLLQDSKIADPVWLNIPGQLLNDIQTNAEYVAYAINYIYGISNRRSVSVLSWSQGGVDAQWAYKYWPSTRSKVTDQISFSPDYKGTTLASFAATPHEPLPPSVLQQQYNSQFITTLRSNEGDSAYVPTTTIYSGFYDEVVEPQQGTGASAYLLDARNVGVTNNEVQTICPGQPAGGFFGHEGVLYNNLGYALAVDALQHDGPGQVARLDLPSVCSYPITEGLNLADVLETENTLLIAGLSILLYPSPSSTEPAIKSYARS